MTNRHSPIVREVAPRSLSVELPGTQQELSQHMPLSKRDSGHAGVDKTRGKDRFQRAPTNTPSLPQQHPGCYSPLPPNFQNRLDHLYYHKFIIVQL